MYLYSIIGATAKKFQENSSWKE